MKVGLSVDSTGYMVNKAGYIEPCSLRPIFRISLDPMQKVNIIEGKKRTVCFDVLTSQSMSS